MRTRTSYRCGPACIAVETDDPNASRWLAEFVTPWFEPCSVIASAHNVRFTVSGAAFESIDRRCATAATRPFPCFGLDRGVVALPGWSEEDTTVLADTELGSFYSVSARGVEVTARPDFARARIGLMRVVRELLVAGRQARAPLLDLHAAAFATPAGAILLAGPKRAGKTTLLTHFLRCGDVSLIANDRVLVDDHPASPVVFGVPVLVSIRESTLEIFPELRRTPDERPAVLHSGEVARPVVVRPSDPGPHRDFGLTPWQLAQRCGSATTRCAPIATIVFPEFDAAWENCSLEPLSVKAGAMRLLEARYGGSATGRPRTLFEDMMSPCEPHGDDSLARVTRLSADVPLFRCRLGPGAYRNGAHQLLRRLLSGRSPVEHPR